jgi:hypothetical protein
MYTVSFIGLNYFNACKVGERDALIPNGTPGGANGLDQLPPHFASFFIEKDRCDSYDWWPEQTYPLQIPLEIKIGEFRTVDVIEFRIPLKPKPETPPVVLRFPCNKGTLTNRNLDDGLPSLQRLGVVLDDHPDVIAKVPFPGGDLEVFRFGGSTLVRWLIVDHEDTIKITASGGDKERWVKLKNSDGSLPAEIVFSNTIELVSHTTNGGNAQSTAQSVSMKGGGKAGMHPDVHADMHADKHGGMAQSAVAGAPVNAGMHHHGGSAGHFILFAKLDKDRGVTKLEAATADSFPDTTNLRPAAFNHPYLSYLSSLRETPEVQCSGSCCAKGGTVHG